MTIGIGEITHGYSSTGAEEFKKNIQKQLISETILKLKDITKIKNSFQIGWQGPSQLNFITNLEKAINETELSLNEISIALDKQFSNLEESWAEQDKYMVSID